MTEDKMRKMVTGGVVALTATIVLLVMILGYSVVKVCVSSHKLKRAEAEYARLLEEETKAESTLAYYKTSQGKYALALDVYGFDLPQKD